MTHQTAGLEDLHREQGLRQVLRGIRVPEPGRAAGGRQHDRHARRAEGLVQQDPGVVETVGAVDDDHPVVVKHPMTDGGDHEVEILLRHVQAVLVHQGDPRKLDASQLTQRRQHHVEVADAIARTPPSSS